MKEFAVRPNPDDPRLTRRVEGINHEGRAVEISVERNRGQGRILAADGSAR
jgi:FdhD protein